MNQVFSPSVGALALILLCQSCGATDGGRTGAGGTTDAGGTAAGGTADEGGTGGVSGAGTGGEPPDVGCESLQCRNGRVSFGSGCPGPYTQCDPATNDGVECVPSGPCPSDVVDVTPCVETQTSTDPLNCGTCGEVCAPSVLLTDADLLSGLVAADATAVYFTSGVDDRIRKLPATGGTPITLFAGSGEAYSQAIAVASAQVYWASFDRQTARSSVLAVPVDGGEPTTVVSGQPAMRAIAVDSTNVYWLGTLDGKVMKVPLAGGEPTTLATGEELLSLAVDATSVYFTMANLEDPTRGSVMRVAIDGGTPTRLAEGSYPGDSGTLAVDANNVYFVAVIDGTNDEVLSVPIAGGTVTTLASGVTWPGGIALDGTDLYWTSHGRPTDPAGVSGALAKVPLAGGPVVTLAHRLGNPRSIAVGDSSIFWAQDYGEGKVMRVAKDPCRHGACVE